MTIRLCHSHPSIRLNSLMVSQVADNPKLAAICSLECQRPSGPDRHKTCFELRSMAWHFDSTCAIQVQTSRQNGNQFAVSGACEACPALIDMELLLKHLPGELCEARLP